MPCGYEVYYTIRFQINHRSPLLKLKIEWLRKHPILINFQIFENV